jgi:hypothetical protein
MSVNQLKLKRSAVSGRYPTTSSLALGELAVNTYEGKIFLKKDDGVQTIVEIATTSGSILSASYAATSSYASNFLVDGTIRARTLIVSVVSSSITYSSGSNKFGDDATDTQQLTGSVGIQGPLTVTGNTVISSSLNVRNAITASVISGSLYNLQGSPTHIPYFSTSQVLSNSPMSYVVTNEVPSIVINQSGVTTAAPEALYVYQASTSSYNVISGKGNLDSYLQLNIQNVNVGPTASSDIVATANNGNETSNYIDMGINSSNFSGPIGDANDAYLYSTGRHLHIGNASNFPIQFFVGGDDTNATRKFELNVNGQHNMTGSLEMSGSLNVNFNTTASNARVTQTLIAQTVSASTIYSSGSNRFGGSLSTNQIFTGSILMTGSLDFKGNQSLTGSLNISGGAVNINGVNVLDTALAYAIALG